MSKHEVLTISEFNNYQINPCALNVILEYQKKHQLKTEKIRILDFGCGRGRSVLKLKLKKYDAFGVDIDKEPIDNAGKIYQHFNLNADKYLFNIEENCKVPFPDNYFDIVFSEQVVEHVKDINAFFEEMARILKPRGETFHAFPYKYHFTEQHLYMPIIHWLPKNRLRKIAIYFWLRMGRDPKWKSLNRSSIANKAEKYYTYSISNTYYRSNNILGKVLRKNGFQVKMKCLKRKFDLKHLNSYFPHTTHIIATKSH